jgi:hypothetical protein
VPNEVYHQCTAEVSHEVGIIFCLQHTYQNRMPRCRMFHTYRTQINLDVVE